MGRRFPLLKKIPEDQFHWKYPEQGSSAGCRCDCLEGFVRERDHKLYEGLGNTFIQRCLKPAL